jgi:UDP-N-acetylmuramyl pentapeptide phosphotransferase/UDP-N-acetylglucosamine-1-phosphate transferase
MTTISLMPIVLFGSGILMALLFLPRIIKIANYRNLLDKPNERSSHSIGVPRLGGIVFYICLVFAIGLSGLIFKSNFAFLYQIGLLIVFLTGMKDDIMVISPTTKLLGQLLTVGCVLMHPDLQLNNLHGFLGIHEIPLWLGMIISGILMIFILNAVNLVDGIDGLAGIIGIITLGALATIFYFEQEYLHFNILVALIGAIIGFLRFNFSKSKKLFMGDTGSLIIGFVIAVSVIRVISMHGAHNTEPIVDYSTIPFILFGILAVPAIDTCRVFTMRIMAGKNPMSADRTHIHHILLGYFNHSHLVTSLIIGLISIVLIATFSLSAMYLNQIQLLGVTFIVFFGMTFGLQRLKTNFDLKNSANTKKTIFG